MKMIKRILVISRMNPYSRKAILFGVALARKYEAKLLVLHITSNPVAMMPVNTPWIFPEEDYTYYMINQQAAKEQLDKILKKERRVRFPIKELISEGDSVDEIVRVVSKEKIDLIVMPAHEEGRIEHALFGGANDDIIRKMPCSILLVKNEPEPLKST